MTPKRAKVVFYKDEAGEIRWHYYAPNGKLVAESGEGYARMAAAKRGYAAVVKHAAVADVEVKE